MKADAPVQLRKIVENAPAFVEKAPRFAGEPRQHTLRAIPGGEFVAQFRALEQLWDGVVPRNRIITLTAPTGAGKTAIQTAMELHMAVGRPFAGRDLAGGKVLSLCGENPDDKRMRMIATAQHMGIESQVLDGIGVIPDVFSVEHRWQEIEAEASRLGGLALVSVDTSAAFFMDGDENDNVAMRRHASSLRALTGLPGKPAVIVLCHPTKNATKDNLLPRGGGSFLAEVDGNLTAWKDDSGIVTLHWAGKFRGPGFDPIRFELKPWQLAGYADAKGRPVHSVVAVHVSDDHAEQIHAKELDDQDRLLIALQRKPGASVRDLAMACGWINPSGKALSTRADRRLRELKSNTLADQDRKGQWRLTSKGQKEAEALP